MKVSTSGLRAFAAELSSATVGLGFKCLTTRTSKIKAQNEPYLLKVEVLAVGDEKVDVFNPASSVTVLSSPPKAEIDRLDVVGALPVVFAVLG